jgi:hypothetical protein
LHDIAHCFQRAGDCSNLLLVIGAVGVQRFFNVLPESKHI